MRRACQYTQFPMYPMNPVDIKARSAGFVPAEASCLRLPTAYLWGGEGGGMQKTHFSKSLFGA